MLRKGLMVGAWLALAACDIPFPEPEPYVAPTLPSDEELVAQRPYRVITPPGFDGGTPLPLLLALHGYGGDSTALEARFNLKQLAQSRGILLVMPNALQDAQGTPAWHPKNETAPPFDREYLRALLLDAKKRYPVDPARVFVFGYSQGGHMAHRLTCDSADLVAAIAVVAGQAPKVPSECMPVQPVAVVQVHGTADQAITYAGNPDNPLVISAHDTVATWGRNDGCGALTSTPKTMDLSIAVEGDETTVEAYADCPPGIDVELWTMNGVEHNPAPQPTFSSQVYSFLARHPRR